MKIAGKTAGAYKDYFVLPRPEGEFVFHLNAVENYLEFDELCPRPSPPVQVKPDGTKIMLLEDPSYQAHLNDYQEAKWHWRQFKCLAQTPGLTWEKVDPTNWTTFKNLEAELREFGMSEGEIIQLYAQINTVNGTDTRKLDEARANFLRTLQVG